MDWTGPILIFVLFALMFMFIMKIGHFPNGSINKDFPPGPWPMPIIGNLHIMDLKRPYRTLHKVNLPAVSVITTLHKGQRLSKTYGPVFSIQMGLKKMVVLSGYKTVKEALMNQADAFAERAEVPIFEELTRGYGITFAHGENWKAMRRFALSTLRDFGMGKRAIEDRIVEECEYLTERFESYKGKPFETITIVNGAVANIIVSILIGERFDYEDPRFIRLITLINETVRLVGSPSISIYNICPALGFLLKAYRTIIQNRDEFYAFAQVTFMEHLKKLDKNDQRSLIDVFLIKQQEEKYIMKEYFHNDNLKNLVFNLFVAGMETASTTLRWGLFLMMKYPKIQQKVHDEIDRVVGSNPPRIEHRAKMPYTDAVIHEIQRFANILPLNLPHATTMDVTFKGYFIPKSGASTRVLQHLFYQKAVVSPWQPLSAAGSTLPFSPAANLDELLTAEHGTVLRAPPALLLPPQGTYIIPFLGSVLRDISQWEKPDDFYPEHFLDSKGKFVKKEAFMPFSAGRRMCAGETLAKMELFLFFTSLLQRFTFHPAPGISPSDLDLTPAAGVVTSPMPHKVCAVPRV